MIGRITNTITSSNFWIKLTHWEFWPFGLVYTPLFMYWFWLSLKARSFFFFSASNPGIENGGMLGESKFDIHQKLPTQFTPFTEIAPYGASAEQVLKVMAKNQLKFPVILKPDIGERGWMVEKIRSEDDLKAYLKINRVDFLIQEYLDMEMEFGVFYFRYPGKEKGQITSIVQKRLLSVTGDGVRPIRQLMLDVPRAKLQIENLRAQNPGLLDKTPMYGETIVLMPIGNHCRGTAFLDGNYIINQKLESIFDDIAKQIDGFYFGRFDIRCHSVGSLQSGDFKIMELNGAGSEPGHIYQPGSSIFQAYKSLFFHWKALYEISKLNKKTGVPYLTFNQGLSAFRKVRKYNRQKDPSLKFSYR